jgi:excisionase family DNA binding protein
MEDLLDIAAVARYLGVSERTVYNRVRAGDLPAVKIGRLWRVRRSELETWLAMLDREPEVLSASVVAEGGAVPSRADLEATLSLFADRIERRLAFVGMLSRAYEVLGWSPPVVVGGHAVEFWTAGGYSTVDIDLVGASEPAVEVLARWGFERQGRYWLDEPLGLVVEIPGSRLSPGQQEHTVSVRLGGVTTTVLGIEDLIIDRLNACVHWEDEESCLWAEALLGTPDGLDEEYLIERAMEEGISERLALIRERTDGR